MKNIYIILLSLIFNQIHFIDIPNDTGIFHPIIIEECMGLDIGDEIGLFDNNGLISSDCSNQYNEILVGSGVYNGEQITISGIGSFDFCDLNDGYQLPGWIDGNSIQIKVWDASDDIEYIPEVNYTTGTGNWGDIFSVINMLVVNELSLNQINNFSLFSAYPNPFNPSITFKIHDDYQDNVNITVYNLLGKNIYSTFYNSKNNNSVIWDASNYDSGIYLVKFYNSNLSLTKKITLIK